MIICREHKFVFISTPKGGTHSMYCMLLNRFDCQRVGGFHNRRIPPAIARQKFFVFTTVRNPYTRAVSGWAHAVDREPRFFPVVRGARSFSFLDFLKWLQTTKDKNGLTQTQSRWLKRVPYDRFLKLEQLEEQFMTLPFAKGQFTFPKLNTSHIKASDCLNDETAALIEKWASADFDNFGYSRDWRDAI